MHIIYWDNLLCISSRFFVKHATTFRNISVLHLFTPSMGGRFEQMAVVQHLPIVLHWETLCYFWMCLLIAYCLGIMKSLVKALAKALPNTSWTKYFELSTSSMWNVRWILYVLVIIMLLVFIHNTAVLAFSQIGNWCYRFPGLWMDCLCERSFRERDSHACTSLGF